MSYSNIKHFLDKVISIIIVITFFWIFALVSLVCYFNLGLPIIYYSKRVGQHGKVFTMYKFRTMEKNANKPKNIFMSFLRLTSLDEIPQFFNVLFGDMSIIGPRPHDVDEDYIFSSNISNYNMRKKIRPGVTGWAQVNGNRGGNNLEKIASRVDFDLFYYKNLSIQLDIKIFLKTIKVVLFPKH